MFKDILNHTKFHKLNFIHSSVYIIRKHALSSVHFLHHVLCLFIFLIVLIWSLTVVLQHFSKSDKQGRLTTSGLLKLWVAIPNGVTKYKFGVAKQYCLTNQQKTFCWTCEIICLLLLHFTGKTVFQAVSCLLGCLPELSNDNNQLSTTRYALVPHRCCNVLTDIDLIAFIPT